MNCAVNGYVAEIIGYPQPWIATPGEKVSFKVSAQQPIAPVVRVCFEHNTFHLASTRQSQLILLQVSCTEPSYTYSLRRVIQGVKDEYGPEQEVEDVEGVPGGRLNGRMQYARPGSFACVENLRSPGPVAGVEISLYFEPHLPEAGHPQTLISTLSQARCTGLSVEISAQGALGLRICTGRKVEFIDVCFRPSRKRWAKVTIAVIGDSVKTTCQPLPCGLEVIREASETITKLESAGLFDESSTLLIAGSNTGNEVSDFFNGRIDSPKLSVLDVNNDSLVIAHYDFSIDIGGDIIYDISGSQQHGRLINAPTRAVRGYDWDGHEVDWRRATYGYGAIHFHEDDLDDAEWETDFEITLPKDLRSGIYVTEVASTSQNVSDWITFIVRPPPSMSTERLPKAAVVLSTFTYMAYANDRCGDPSSTLPPEVAPGFNPTTVPRNEFLWKIIRRHDLGNSTYGRHRDGSGIVYSTSRRPMLNFRPDYVLWMFQRPRELAPDSMLIGFLERNDISYDVLTDHDLHITGPDVLARYSCVITGSHPEYQTVESYNAYQRYLEHGGNLMYLGGNGFYWVTALDSSRPWRLETRRCDQGVRTYALPGGEHHLSLNGLQGGIWRSRGRSSHSLVGVSFCAQGAGPGVPYRRTEASYDQSIAWMFNGINGPFIGRTGIAGGASGDEIDSFDIAHGSPSNAIVVASSTGHPDGFGIAPECVGFPLTATLGTQTREIRSDLVYFRTNAGGAVFSVGSINWISSLAYNDYNNDVARLSMNVIREFVGIRV